MTSNTDELNLTPEEEEEETFIYERLHKDTYIVKKIFDAITWETGLIFHEDEVEVFVLGKFEDSPLTYLPIDPEDIYSKPMPIGWLFQKVYEHLKSTVEKNIPPELDTKYMVEVEDIKWDMTVLETIVKAADNTKKWGTNFCTKMELLMLTEELKPIIGRIDMPNKYGGHIKKCSPKDREIEINNFLMEIKSGNCVLNQYRCENLFQICGAILDYCFNFNKKIDETFSINYSLRRCKRCGSYFVTDDRRIELCRYKDENGLTCAEKQEIDRKGFQNRESWTEARKMESTISNRLSNYVRAAKNSSKDNSEEIKERERLLVLYRKKREERRNSSEEEYLKWLQTAESLMPQKRKDGYGKLNEWLQGKE